MAAEQELSATGYIQHHLSFNVQAIGNNAFWALNVDSLVTGAILGIVATGLMWWIVRGATAGVPNKRQAFVELLFGFGGRTGKGDLPRQTRFRRARRPHGVRVGAANERHGLPAGRLGRGRS